MPWRPIALERDGDTLTLHGEGLEPGAAPNETELGEQTLGMHRFAISAPRAGIARVRLDVLAHAKTEVAGQWRASARHEAEVAVDPTRPAVRDAATVTPDPAKPGAYDWAIPRVAELPFRGGAASEGVASVGALAPETEPGYPPATLPAKPHEPVAAVVVTPVLQTGEWCQLRRVGWALGTCHLEIAVFHDTGDRDKNIPHRDALIVPLLDHGGAASPPVVVDWRVMSAERTGGLYRPVRLAAPRPDR